MFQLRTTATSALSLILKFQARLLSYCAVYTRNVAPGAHVFFDGGEMRVGNFHGLHLCAACAGKTECVPRVFSGKVDGEKGLFGSVSEME